jgi:hypothetical protein
MLVAHSQALRALPKTSSEAPSLCVCVCGEAGWGRPQRCAGGESHKGMLVGRGGGAGHKGAPST